MSLVVYFGNSDSIVAKVLLHDTGERQFDLGINFEIWSNNKVQSTMYSVSALQII
jgi:hypothetical protein